MQRRMILWVGVLLALALAAGWAWRVWRQPAPAPVRVALLPFTTVNERVMAGFKQALAEHGWVEGRNVAYRATPADGAMDKLDARMAEFMAWKPHLVLAMSTPPSQAAYRATKGTGTAVVFAPATDPLAAGIVSGLARPGEQITGIRLLPSNGLRLEYLQRVAPQARKIYVPYHRGDRSAESTLAQIEPAARSLGLQLLLRPVEGSDDLAAAARDIPADVGAVFLPQDSRIEAVIEQFVAACERRRLPLSAPGVIQVEQGALMTFGFDHAAIGRQAGRLAAAILAGTPPGNLPVEAAENALFINLRAAQAIGLPVDEALLRQAKGIIR